MGGCFSAGGPDEFSRQAIEEHNKYRRRHGAPPLTWNGKAASKARRWASHLAKTKRLEHGNHDGMGQNLAYYSGGTFTPEHAVKLWYDEISDYNFNNPQFASNTGHFTQLVWKGTTQVGIGRATSGQTTYVVANYVPPGNVMGKFPENVLRAS